MSDPIISFADLDLPAPLLKAVQEVGYEAPSPIQAECIPLLLEGHDLLGQAQTGTGKTAAFALPLMAHIDLDNRDPQLLVLTPTRELAIQVAEAMQSYARFLKNFHVLPIYGGQGFTQQLRHLKRGVSVIVGTPGRVMDHMRRGTLVLDHLKALVLDEADEMLRMGFIDDVKWVLEHTPDTRQIALFSATMPKLIQQVAEKHLNKPKVIRIKSKTTTAATIRQRYWVASGLHKLDALTRVLETAPSDGIIIFVRTKTATQELAEKLEARGFSAEALNGDIPQPQREKTVDRLRAGKIDILVATDVAARGLDVQRISHVINYDIPYDTESYVHRIGRTGRAGREGEAILFVAPRERRMLRSIEKATGHPIESMQMPTVKDINQGRLQRFKQRVLDTLQEKQDLSLFYQLLKEVEQESDVDALEIASALACMMQGDVPLLLKENEHSSKNPAREKPARDRSPRQVPERKSSPHSEKFVDPHPKPLKEFPAIEMRRYRVEVGYQHGVKPGNIVGAIANEGELESQYIGHIEIFDDFSTVDLPDGMPKETLRDLQKAWVCNQKLGIKLLSDRVSHKPESPQPGKPSEAGKSRARPEFKPGKPRKPGKPGKKPGGKKPRKGSASKT